MKGADASSRDPCRELLRDEVEDEDVVEDGTQFLDEGLVSFVGDVGIEAGFVGKGDDEAMGESLGFLLGAEVGAPFEVGDRVDFGGKGGEAFLDGFDLSGGGVLLELEADDVAVV